MRSITNGLAALATIAALALPGCATLGNTPNPYLKDVQYLGSAAEIDPNATNEEPSLDLFDPPVGISISTRSYINDLIEHYIFSDSILNERTWGHTNHGKRISYTAYDFDKDGTIDFRSWCLHSSREEKQVLIETSGNSTHPVYTYFEYNSQDKTPEITILGSIDSLHRNHEFLSSEGLDWLFRIETDELEQQP